jgi:vesicle transport through interaction with t-SNAREs protein 1
MDLEARSLQPNVKAVLLAKLREYKSDLNNLKSEVKRIVSGNLNAAARDELLESGMADALTVCPKLHSFLFIPVFFRTRAKKRPIMGRSKRSLLLIIK